MHRVPALLQFALREEIGDPNLFTGRQKELTYFLDWVDLVKREIGQSQVMLARKRGGKTSLVQRLFNVIYTRNDPAVIPIFFRVPEGPISGLDYADLFLRSLLSQYLAFKQRKPEWISRPLELPQLKDLTQDDPILGSLLDSLALHLGAPTPTKRPHPYGKGLITATRPA